MLKRERIKTWGTVVRIETKLITVCLDQKIQEIEIPFGQRFDILSAMISYNDKIEPMDYLRISLPFCIDYIFHAGLMKPFWINGCIGCDIKPTILIEQNTPVKISVSPRICNAYFGVKIASIVR